MAPHPGHHQSASVASQEVRLLTASTFAVFVVVNLMGLYLPTGFCSFLTLLLALVVFSLGFPGRLEERQWIIALLALGIGVGWSAAEGVLQDADEITRRVLPSAAGWCGGMTAILLRRRTQR